MNQNDQVGDIFSFSVEKSIARIELKSNAYQIMVDLDLKRAFLQQLEEIRTNRGITGLFIFDSSESLDYENYVRLVKSIDQLKSHLFVNAEKQIVSELLKFSIPVVAGIQGRVPIEHFGYYLACDYRISAADLQIEFPDLSMGMTPGAASYFLSKEIGANKTLELYLMGEPVSANDAKSLHIVNEVVTNENLINTCEEKLNRFAALTRGSLASAKSIIKPSITELEEHLDRTLQSFFPC